MERKGLSQILYLIIAASVLMMVAMVVTFSATDVLSLLTGQATESACTDSIAGTCAAQGTDFVELPVSQCITDEQYVQGITSSDVVDSPGGTGTTDASTVVNNPTNTYYVVCSNF
jgi:hypothetical protein